MLRRHQKNRKVLYDERLLEMTAEDLNTIFEIGLEISGTDTKPYLFLDEIQNIDGWEKFVRRMADMKYRINITGSNSKMPFDYQQ